jgi:signal transduction histidine kinase
LISIDYLLLKAQPRCSSCLLKIHPSMVPAAEALRKCMMNSISSSPPRSIAQNHILRVGIGLALVAAALELSLLFESSFGNPFFGFFFPSAVIATTWFCGTLPGWLATALSIVVVQYYFIPPLRSFSITLHDLPFSLTFLLCQVFATWLVIRRKQAENSLRQANTALFEQMGERERAEESLRAARSELARFVRVTTVGELTATIAHEINQPLAAVVANSDACIAWLGSDKPDLPEARAAAERAAMGATRASDVIRRIRSLISKGPDERAPLQLNTVISEIVDLTTHQALSNNVSMTVDLQPDLPSVPGDKIQLQQVMLNLISNGIEATSGVNGRPGRLEIRSQSLGTHQLQVSVRDNGVGVPPELMARLFEPFFTTREQGIGMGLPISRSIIEAHGGRLWAESSPNQGSVFRFTLPYKKGVAP